MQEVRGSIPLSSTIDALARILIRLIGPCLDFDASRLRRFASSSTRLDSPQLHSVPEGTTFGSSGLAWTSTLHASGASRLPPRGSIPLSSTLFLKEPRSAHRACVYFPPLVQLESRSELLLHEDRARVALLADVLVELAGERHRGAVVAEVEDIEQERAVLGRRQRAGRLLQTDAALLTRRPFWNDPGAELGGDRRGPRPLSARLTNGATPRGTFAPPSILPLPAPRVGFDVRLFWPPSAALSRCSRTGARRMPVVSG